MSEPHLIRLLVHDHSQCNRYSRVQVGEKSVEEAKCEPFLDPKFRIHQTLVRKCYFRAYAFRSYSTGNFDPHLGIIA